jgi:hypothetical protein
VTIAHGAGRLIATLVRLVLGSRHIAIVHIAAAIGDGSCLPVK